MSAEVMTMQIMSREQAERVTEQIAYRIDSITENYEVVMSLMRDALARNAHEALGYASPGAYIAERFGQSLQTLGVALRREFVHELSDAGLSTRAIAPVFDVSHVQISKDLKSGVNPVNTSPNPVEAEGFIVNPSTGEVLDEPSAKFAEPSDPVTTEHTVTEKIKTVTGLDGKEYKRPEPAAPRRRPITEQARDLGWDMRKQAEKLQRIIADDRFNRNKEEVAAHIRGHLMFAVEVCQDLLDTLNK